MKKLSLIFAFTLLFTLVFCQSKETAYNVTTDVSILVNDIEKVKKDIDPLVEKENTSTTYYSINKNRFYINVITDSLEYQIILNEIKSWGFIISENTVSNNKINEISNLKQEIGLLKNEKNQYQSLVSKLDSSTQSKYFDYWEKIISIDKEISEKEVNINTLKALNKNYVIKIRFEEEEIVGHSYGDQWVNMPGFEFSLLKTEQPKTGVSPDLMLGYNLKYLVNHKKTYALLGLYKSQQTSQASEINEMYTFALGQDFYSRKLGRGQREFLNLYTSFNLGVYISSSELDKSNSWFVNPFIGLELFKNKHILIDNKFGYFLPFQNNRYQRGFLYNASFNFVF